MKNHDEDAIRSQLDFLQLQLGEFSAHSVVDVALDALAETKAWTLQDVQAMPWLTLLIVKWAMQNPNCKLYLEKSISRLEFDKFRQRAWDLTGPAKSGSSNLNTMLRSMLPVQIEFQRRAPWGFMRWACLIARLPPEHLSRQQFVNELQLSPEEFIDACWIVLAPIFNGGLVISVKWLSGIPAAHKRSVDRLLHMLGIDFLGLRSALSKHWPTYRPSSWELFELPFVRKFPFFRTSNGDWRIWHPVMFERSLEDAREFKFEVQLYE